MNASTALVRIDIPEEVTKTLCGLLQASAQDTGLRDELGAWLGGERDVVLLARRLDRDAATGAFYATLEFTEGFLEFLAALRAGNLQRHLL